MPQERHFSFTTGSPSRDIEPKEINLNLGSSQELGADIVKTINDPNATMTGIVANTGAVYWSTSSQIHQEITQAAITEDGISENDIVAQIQSTNIGGKLAALYVLTTNIAVARQVGAFLQTSVDQARHPEVALAIDTGVNPQFTNIQQVRAAGNFYRAVPGGRTLYGFRPNQIK